jgi:hypothetical protein
LRWSTCTESTSVSRIKLSDRGSSRTAIVNNISRLQFDRTRFDGCVLQNATAADWVLCLRDIGQVIVELKGVDLEHGAKQVSATADFLKSNQLRNGRIAGLVVGSQYPAINTRLQRAKSNFMKQYGGALHFVSRNRNYEFDRLLAADGPG